MNRPSHANSIVVREANLRRQIVVLVTNRDAPRQWCCYHKYVVQLPQIYAALRRAEKRCSILHPTAV